MGALLALVMPAIPAPAQVFLVTGANGQAQVGRDQHSYQPAVVNSNHSLPSWGRTGDNSSLTIAFNAENKFRLLPNSEAQVYAGDGDSNSAWHRVVGLKIGTATISHDTGAAPAVKLDCETPTAVCGAVGTEFEVDATEGKYSVSQGRISLISHQEGDLVMPRIVGGTVVFNPGAQNTYSNGDFSGVVILDGVTMQAAGADFTVAKKLDSSSETAVHIASGRLGGTGPGDYVMEGGRLKPVDPSKASIHPQYLAAAKREGALSVERAALRASSNRVAPRGLDAALSAAAARATALREELFNRETAREVNKQVTGALIDSALRGGR
ncbi:MAG TPA: FecR domain-containing protein [Candidatus Methylacidiphilales bacterium]|nr:FecR domain-containing protein [Candidatus Methylacidiphilales bacterium]